MYYKIELKLFFSKEVYNRNVLDLIPHTCCKEEDTYLLSNPPIPPLAIVGHPREIDLTLFNKLLFFRFRAKPWRIKY